jgi:hypothetical protein
MDQILFVQSTQPHQPFFQSIKSKQTKPNQIKSINQPINQIKSIQIKSNQIHQSINIKSNNQSINQSINHQSIKSNQIKSINQSNDQTIKRSNQINQSNDQTINNDDNLNNSQYFGSGTAFLRLVCVACNRLSRRCFANSASSSFRPERNHLVKGGRNRKWGNMEELCLNTKNTCFI